MSKVVPLKACPEIEVWWHHDDELRPDAKPATLAAAAPCAGDAATAAVTAARSLRRRTVAARAVDAHDRDRSDSWSSRRPIRRGAGRIFLALVLGLAAIGLAVVGLTVNTRFAASFGQTAEAAVLLAAIGLTIDLLAIVLPSAAAQLWRDRNIVAAAAAWAIWLIALGMTLLAAIGFAATNIGDGVAGRSRIAAEASALTADVTRLRASAAASPRAARWQRSRPRSNARSRPPPRCGSRPPAAATSRWRHRARPAPRC